MSREEDHCDIVLVGGILQPIKPIEDFVPRRVFDDLGLHFCVKPALLRLERSLDALGVVRRQLEGVIAGLE